MYHLIVHVSVFDYRGARLPKRINCTLNAMSLWDTVAEIDGGDIGWVYIVFYWRINYRLCIFSGLSRSMTRSQRWLIFVLLPIRCPQIIHILLTPYQCWANVADAGSALMQCLPVVLFLGWLDPVVHCRRSQIPLTWPLLNHWSGPPRRGLSLA